MLCHYEDPNRHGLIGPGQELIARLPSLPMEERRGGELGAFHEHRRFNTLPLRAGAGLKPEHVNAILLGRPAMGFFEVHAENYMGAGGPPHARFGHLRARSAVDARRRPFHWRRRATRHGSSRPAQAAERLPAGELFRASGLVEPRGGLPQRSPAGCLYAGDAEPRLRPCRRGAGNDAPSGCYWKIPPPICCSRRAPSRRPISCAT